MGARAVFNPLNSLLFLMPSDGHGGHHKGSGLAFSAPLHRTRFGRLVALFQPQDLWGKRHLAYPVKKQSDGYYVLINFEIEPDAIFEIDRVIKIREEILKHLIVKIGE